MDRIDNNTRQIACPFYVNKTNPRSCNNIRFKMNSKRGLLRLCSLFALVLLYVLFLTKREEENSTRTPNPDASESLQLREETNSGNDTIIAKRNKMRKQLLADFCDKRRGNKTTQGKDFSSILVDEDKKIIYCSIPKVACTQWKTVLSELKGLCKNEACSSRKYIHNRQHFKTLNEYPPEVAQKILDQSFSFLFVREPFERLLSAYIDKFFPGKEIFHRNVGTRIIQMFRPRASERARKTGDDVTFAEFTDYLVHIAKGRGDEHWRTFYESCHPCLINYDFIGHFENLREEGPYVVRKAGIEQFAAFPPYVASDTTSKLLAFYSQIPRDNIVYLGDVYQPDFDIFGYHFPGPLQALLERREPLDNPSVLHLKS